MLTCCWGALDRLIWSVVRCRRRAVNCIVCVGYQLDYHYLAAILDIPPEKLFFSIHSTYPPKKDFFTFCNLSTMLKNEMIFKTKMSFVNSLPIWKLHKKNFVPIFTVGVRRVCWNMSLHKYWVCNILIFTYIGKIKRVCQYHESVINNYLKILTYYFLCFLLWVFRLWDWV